MEHHRIPRFTLDGVSGAKITMHPFSTEDGLGLYLTRFHRADCDDVVVLLHGLTASTDMFIMPEQQTNLVTYLLEGGFEDVWTLDFRMSSRFPYDTETHRFTFDDIAHYDYPAALAELRRHVGDRRVHVVAHCTGSISFAMSLFGGAIDNIASFTSNSVSLNLTPPAFSRLKLAVAPFLSEYVIGLPFVDPRFADAPVLTRAWWLSKAVSLLHPECDVSACHMASFMWGAGRPALYEHVNLLPETHRRMADLLSANGLHYYRHIRKMVRAGHAVKYDASDPRHAELPDNYLERAAEVTTPILFLAGDHNHVFPGANTVTYELMEKAAPGRHEFQPMPGYGHIDPFIGKNAHVDVFPKIVDFLKRKAA